MVYPHRLTKDKKGNSYENDHLFYRSARNVTNLEYQNYLPLVEPGYINLNPRDASMISRACAKTKLVLSSKKNKKKAGKVSYALFLDKDWPIVHVSVPKLETLQVSYIRTTWF